jgi:hypothetical protein
MEEVGDGGEEWAAEWWHYIIFSEAIERRLEVKR